jgi:hypothetical protein
MNEQKPSQDACCTPPNKGCCCSGKKFFIGILTGLAIAVIAHCLMSGGMCGGKGLKTCPISQMQTPPK